ncbi:MAG: cyanophycin synthetase [Pirellulales bacterium]
MALWCFAQRKAGAVVLEVGLGGRLDSTNVVSPSVCVVTSISFDHTKQLGRTLAAIAGEKGGIIKPGVPVVSGVTAAEPRAAIERIAAGQGAPLVRIHRDFDIVSRNQHVSRTGRDPAIRVTRHEIDYLAPQAFGLAPARLEGLTLGLAGRHQAENAALAIAAADLLRSRCPAIDVDAVRRGLVELRWPARIETLRHAPRVILDAAHNTASIAALLETLGEEHRGGTRYLIFAASRDKDCAAMLRQLAPFFDVIVLTQYEHNPRYVPLDALRAMLDDVQRTATGGVSSWHRPWLEAKPRRQPRMPRRALRIQATPTPRAAWEIVRAAAGPHDLVVATGSFFLAAELRPLILEQSE